MGSTSSGGAVNDEASRDSSPAVTRKQIDPIDQPARTLGSKRSKLQNQKRRLFTAPRLAGLLTASKSQLRQVFTSADGILVFALARTPSGLLIERRNWPAAGLRTAQTMVFDDAKAFDRWCDTEPVRFDDPQLHTQLRREGHEVLDSLR